MLRRHSGYFITFESTKEGLGKSTQAQHLAERLEKAGFDVVLTKEPGGTVLGKQLRKILLDKNAYEQPLSKATELFLMLADRAQHYKEVLKPSLKEGKIVISDRYVDSTLVYQGAGRGWKASLLWQLHHVSTGSLLPDLTFVLDGTPFNELDKADRFESENEKFFERVERAMRHIAYRNYKREDNRYIVIDANHSEQELADSLFKTVTERMAGKSLPK